MITEKTLTTLANRYYIEITYKKTSFTLFAPNNHIFHDGKKEKEYVYSNFIFKTIEDARYNALVHGVVT
jgi:hypothetical protein